MYEVELKVEITSKQREDLINLFKEKGFAFKGMTPQHDVYIQAEKSPYGGYDLKRYRSEVGKYIYTQKTWEMIDGLPARKEDEHEVTKEEFDAKVAEYPNALSIKKEREWFDGGDISITIDSIKFDHSPEMRYFIEGEIDVEDKAEVTNTREKIRTFLKESLGADEIVEAPGMFMMAFEKR
jgi:predicted adenylyl cyclase CyaB